MPKPTVSRKPASNAFAQDFLHRMEGLDEPSTAAEAEAAGPWKVQPLEGGAGFALLREEETLEEGDPPLAVFTDRHLALQAAALFPLLDRNPAFTLAAEENESGFPLLAGTQAEGHLHRFLPAFVEALNLVHALAGSPRSLALLLEATGGLALERTGRLLAHRLSSASAE